MTPVSGNIRCMHIFTGVLLGGGPQMRSNESGVVPEQPSPMCPPDSLLRFWRYINHITYLFTSYSGKTNPERNRPRVTSELPMAMPHWSGGENSSSPVGNLTMTVSTAALWQDSGSNATGTHLHSYTMRYITTVLGDGIVLCLARWLRSTQLIYTGPSYYLYGWLLASR